MAWMITLTLAALQLKHLPSTLAQPTKMDAGSQAAVEARCAVLEAKVKELTDSTAKLDRDLDKQYNRTEDLRDDQKVFAEALVATGREQQTQRGRSHLTVFVKGDVANKVKNDLAKFRKESTARKEERDNQQARASTAAASAGSSMQVDTERPTRFNTVFLNTVVKWVQDEVGDGGPRARELRDELAPAVQQLGAVVPDLAVQFVRVGNKPTQTGSTAVTLGVQAGPAGAQLWELLALRLNKLYRVPGASGKPVFADVSVKVDDGAGRDRPLVRRVCEVAGLAVREGKDKGRGRGSGKDERETRVSTKRESPVPDKQRSNRQRK